MSLKISFYFLYLAQELARRKERNKRYSLRAFARDLATDAGLLSRIMKGQVAPSVASARQLASSLGLAGNERKRFVQSVATAREAVHLSQEERDLKPVDVELIANDAFEMISHLHHYALLELSQTEKFDPSPRAIARDLGITVVEAEAAIERLRRLRLLEPTPDGASWRKTSAVVTTQDKLRSSKALRAHQREIMRNALKRLDAEPIDRRVMAGMAMPIDPAKIPLARAMIDEFLVKMTEVMSAGAKHEVYQLHVSFCSLQTHKDV